MPVKFFQSADRNAFLVRYRIAFARQYHTDSRIVLELQIYLIQCSIDTCFHHFDDIILHSRKYNLCLRVSESCIVFQHLRTILCQHQTKKDNSLEWSAFCFHRIYGCLINIFFTECFYFFCIERTRRKCSHSTCVQSCIPISCALVILCGSHGLDRIAIYK